MFAWQDKSCFFFFLGSSPGSSLKKQGKEDQGHSLNGPGPSRFQTLGSPFVEGQHDWTTEVPDNGNEWRKFRIVPRLHPLRSLVLCLFYGRKQGSFPLYGESSSGHIRCRVSYSSRQSESQLLSTFKCFVILGVSQVTTLVLAFSTLWNTMYSRDDRQITHLICVRLRHLLYDFLGGVLDLFYRRKIPGRRPKTPPKSHIALFLGGHRLDE